MDAFNIARSKGREVIKLLAGRFPLLLLRLGLERLETLLSFHTVANDYLSNKNEISSSSNESNYNICVFFIDAGVATTTSSAYILWELFSFFSSMLGKGVILSTEEMQESLHELVGACLQGGRVEGMSDVLLIGERLNSIEHLAPLVKSKPLLQSIFQHYLTIIVESNSSGPSSILLSAKAAGCLSNIARHCGAQLDECQLIVWCCRETQSALTIHMSSSSALTTHLMEVLLILSARLRDTNLQMEVLLGTMRAQIQYLTNPSTLAVFASSDILLHTCSQQSPTHADYILIQEVRNSLSSVLSIAKKVHLPELPMKVWAESSVYSQADLTKWLTFTVVWDALLPMLITALQCMHGLYNPTFRMGNPIGCKLALPLSLFQTHHGEEEFGQKLSIERVDGLLVLLHLMLGQAAVHKSLYIHPCWDALLSILLNTLSYMDNFHLTRFLKQFMEPFLLHAPPFCFSRIAPLVEASFLNLQKRVSVAAGNTALSANSNAEER